MAGLVLGAEQTRSAPREVNEWIWSFVLAELALAPGPERGQDEMAEVALAERTVEEAGLVLEHIRDDYLAAQVFLEIGRRCDLISVIAIASLPQIIAGWLG